MLRILQGIYKESSDELQTVFSSNWVGKTLTAKSQAAVSESYELK